MLELVFAPVAKDFDKRLLRIFWTGIDVEDRPSVGSMVDSREALDNVLPKGSLLVARFTPTIRCRSVLALLFLFARLHILNFFSTD